MATRPETGTSDRLAPVAASSPELARVRESEVRFRQAIDIAPVLMWMSGPDARFTYFNKCWLDFTGRPVETERGHGWTEGIHQDDRQRYQSTYHDAFSHRRPFRTEFRLRSGDGEYRWLLNVGSPMHDEAGSFTGYIGSCVDITDQKIAEQAVATVSGRLIEAQEQERSRLARELHDDINQRLALLAIELEQLRLNPPAAKKELAKRIDELQQTTLDISRDVQALSHELHSSKLDFLGLVPAFSSFCREFSQQKKVAVHFTHADIPLSVPRDISLCLFRVLQEASHNVVKHSGVSAVRRRAARRSRPCVLDDSRYGERLRPGGSDQHSRTWACQHARTTAPGRRNALDQIGRQPRHRDFRRRAAARGAAASAG